MVEPQTREAVRHHFVDMAQQSTAARAGMWLFLVSELMLFGGLFTAYALYRVKYPEAFALASNELDIVAGTVNTAVLLISSATVALAYHFAGKDRWRQTQWCLVLTLVLGALFLAIKAYEYSHKWQEGHVPTAAFEWAGPSPEHARLFFVFYFVMTATHAAHMVAGLGVVGVVWWFARTGKYTGENTAPIEMAGLYWHFVDIVWIFLYPLLYLLARHL